MSELYRDFIDSKADEIINGLGGTITPAPSNTELYRDFLDRKFDDVINAIGNVKIKSFTYTGDGQLTKVIEFDTTPKAVWIYADHEDGSNFSIVPFFVYGSPYIIGINGNVVRGTANSSRTLLVTYSGNELTFDGGSAFRSFNATDVTYTVYYI